jgi:DNA-binding transcriptional MerR regulator
MKIGEVARRAGVSVDTVRHYERRGLLPPAPRSANGYRDWPADTVARIAVIRRALAVGLGVRQIAGFFAARRRGQPPCREARAAVAQRLDEVRAELRDLTRAERDLKVLLAEWDRRLDATPPGEPARLLETLLENPRSAARRKPVRQAVRLASTATSRKGNPR